MSKFKNLLSKLGIDKEDEMTKPATKETTFTKVRDVVYKKRGYNFMSDLIELPNDEGYKYLFVIVDLFSDNIDFEEMKTKKATEALSALKTIAKRPYISLKTAYTLATDGGNEFKGAFQKFLYNNSIYHKTSRPSRHSQQANVERANRTVSRLLNAVMNKDEKETGIVSRSWRKALKDMRTELNKIREKKEQRNFTRKRIYLRDTKYKIGQSVYYKLDSPQNISGGKVHGTFREGDRRWSRQTRKIVNILPFQGDIPYRYVLSHMKNVSFTEAQLKLAKDQDKSELFLIDRIMDIRGSGKNKKIKIKWKGFQVSDATWEKYSEIMKTAPSLVKRFEDENK